jgi:hypothetical protein
MNVLRRTKLTPLDENATMTVQSLRESFNQSGGFVYNSVKGSSSKVLLPSDPTMTGYARDLELDLYWANTKVEPGTSTYTFLLVKFPANRLTDRQGQSCRLGCPAADF